MKAKDIKNGETYLFLATDAPARKHLEGQPFRVEYSQRVWRRTFKKSRQVTRFFNEDGVGARAEELEPIDQPAEGQPVISAKSNDDLPF